MPRGNILIIFVVATISLVCFQRVDHNPYSRYLSQVLDEIDKHALDEIPRQELFEGAMEGIVGKLNDRIDENSAYISQGKAEKFEAELRQEIVGIGVRIKIDEETKQLTVISPPEFGSPAQRAGIRAHDKILAINGKDTAGLAMDEVINRIRGPAGSSVTLKVLHAGGKEPVEYTIQRQLISVPSVLGERPLAKGSWDYLLDQDRRIAYIRVLSFGEKTYDELQAALKHAHEQGAEALVLDLRDNAGGLLESAVEICKLFLPADQTIVSIRGRKQKAVVDYVSSDAGPYADLPLAVLVNGFSASASEIVAACLQDHDRAAIIGSRSYGKGTVQHIIHIESGKSILKLTAASYWRPSNKNIHRRKDAKETDDWGVLPDKGLEVKLTEAEERQVREARSLRDVYEEPGSPPPAEKEQPAKEGAPPEPAADQPLGDPQLRKAIEVLEQKLKQVSAQAKAA